MMIAPILMLGLLLDSFIDIRVTDSVMNSKCYTDVQCESRVPG